MDGESAALFNVALAASVSLEQCAKPLVPEQHCCNACNAAPNKHEHTPNYSPSGRPWSLNEMMHIYKQKQPVLHQMLNWLKFLIRSNCFTLYPYSAVLTGFQHVNPLVGAKHSGRFPLYSCCSKPFAVIDSRTRYYCYFNIPLAGRLLSGLGSQPKP